MLKQFYDAGSLQPIIGNDFMLKGFAASYIIISCPAPLVNIISTSSPGTGTVRDKETKESTQQRTIQPITRGDLCKMLSF